MATLTKRYGKKQQDGSIGVTLRLRHGNTEVSVPTGIVLCKGEYREYADGRIRVTNDRKYFELEDLFADMTRRMNEFLRTHMFMDFSARDVLRGISSVDCGTDVLDMDFFEFAERWIESSGIKGKKNYVTMLNDLARFLTVRKLRFGDVTYQLLSVYSRSLADRPRARTLYLGEIRHLWKQACLEYNTDEKAYLSVMLFERFKVPKQVARGQRALSVDEVRRVFGCDVRKGSRQELAKDCCMLSFCLMGTNSVDLYNATEYKDGVLAYERTKTRDRRADRARIEIEVPMQVMRVFEKYRDRSGRRVFSFYRRYSSESTFNAAINKGLKEIGEITGIDGLQFYRFRHAVATVARNELRFAKSDVDELLNHVGENRIADIYIKRDYSVVNEINRRVVEFVLGRPSLTTGPSPALH